MLKIDWFFFFKEWALLHIVFGVSWGGPGRFGRGFTQQHAGRRKRRAVRRGSAALE